MAINGLQGTVVDLTDELKSEFDFMVEIGRFKGNLDEYMTDRQRSPLVVAFDSVTQVPGGSISSVAVSLEDYRTGKIQAGQRVECAIEPGSTGTPSRLLNIQPL